MCPAETLLLRTEILTVGYMSVCYNKNKSCWMVPPLIMVSNSSEKDVTLFSNIRHIDIMYQHLQINWNGFIWFVVFCQYNVTMKVKWHYFCACQKHCRQWQWLWHGSCKEEFLSVSLFWKPSWTGQVKQTRGDQTVDCTGSALFLGFFNNTADEEDDFDRCLSEVELHHSSWHFSS